MKRAFVMVSTLLGCGGTQSEMMTPPDAASLDALVVDAAPVDDACGLMVGTLSAFGDTSLVLPDVTNDGVPEDVSITVEGGGMYRLALGAATVVVPTHLVAVGTGDLDTDGVRDLVLGMPWLNRVAVYRGPVTGELVAGDADLTIEGPPVDGGLAPLFGSFVLVTDTDVDGVRDVVVGAPGEREEACEGTIGPRVHRGPFGSGAQRTDADASLVLQGEPGSCLGESFRCKANAIAAATKQGAEVCYAIPLTVAEHAACDP